MTGPFEVADGGGYDGPALLVVDGREIAVHARLSGRFEPIAGRYQWAGRVRPCQGLRESLRPNVGVHVHTEAGPAEGTVGEEDPWGGFRISGRGRPPFPVPTQVP